MTQSQKMKIASKKADEKIHKRGLVPPTLKKKTDDFPVGPVVLAFFIFVVCGSVIFQLLQSIRQGRVA